MQAKRVFLLVALTATLETPLVASIRVAVQAVPRRTRAVRHSVGQRLMWIGAHPDDEGLVVPIIANECAQNASACRFLVFTHGERGDCALVSGCGDLGSLRATEMMKAAALLNADLVLWTFSDVGENVDATWSAEAGGHEKLIDQISRAVADFNPTIVYTFDPNHGSTCHPAHRAVGELVLEAISQERSPDLILIETVAIFAGNGIEFSSAAKDAVEVDVSDQWDYLIRDVQAHTSQFTPQQVESLRATPIEKRRAFIFRSPLPLQPEYTFHCDQ